MIDLHIHSKYSDGTDSVIEILQKAEALGLDTISITDHNKMGAYNELKNIDIRSYYKGKIIKGCEVGCIFDGISIEILAYNINEQILTPWLEKYYSKEAVYNNECKALEIYKNAADQLGIIYDKDVCIPKEGVMWASVAFTNSISKYEQNREKIDKRVLENFNLFYRIYAGNKTSPFFVDETKIKPSLDEALGIIKKADGLAFLAHLCIYEVEDYKGFLNKMLSEVELDGLEAYYSLFTLEQTEYLVDFCNKNNLLMSGGSDYHGTLKKDIELGSGRDSLNVPSSILNDWNRER